MRPGRGRGRGIRARPRRAPEPPAPAPAPEPPPSSRARAGRAVRRRRARVEGPCLYGDPGAPVFRVVSRTAHEMVVELRTPGFVATADPAGAVVEIEGFASPTDPDAVDLPFKRAVLDAVVGRRARIVSVEADGRACRSPACAPPPWDAPRSRSVPTAPCAPCAAGGPFPGARGPGAPLSRPHRRRRPSRDGPRSSPSRSSPCAGTPPPRGSSSSRPSGSASPSTPWRRAGAGHRLDRTAPPPRLPRGPRLGLRLPPHHAARAARRALRGRLPLASPARPPRRAAPDTGRTRRPRPRRARGAALRPAAACCTSTPTPWPTPWPTRAR